MAGCVIRCAARIAAILVGSLISGILPAVCARADTTIPITGIGTQIGAINTHADSVTFSAPQVVAVAGFGNALDPAWSPDGTKRAFQRFDANAYRIIDEQVDDFKPARLRPNEFLP